MYIISCKSVIEYTANLILIFLYILVVRQVAEGCCYFVHVVLHHHASHGRQSKAQVPWALKLQIAMAHPNYEKPCYIANPLAPATLSKAAWQLNCMATQVQLNCNWWALQLNCKKDPSHSRNMGSLRSMLLESAP